MGLHTLRGTRDLAALGARERFGSVALERLFLGQVGPSGSSPMSPSTEVSPRQEQPTQRRSDRSDFEARLARPRALVWLVQLTCLTPLPNSGASRRCHSSSSLDTNKSNHLRRGPDRRTLGLDEDEGGRNPHHQRRTQLRAPRHVIGLGARPSRSQAIISAGDGAKAAFDILSREAGGDIQDSNAPPKA